MTSVGIISSVVARINPLANDSKHSERWKNLQQGLEKMKKSLEDANLGTRRRKEFVKLEKEIVQLAYKIDDAVAASRGLGFLSKLKRTTPDLDSFEAELKDLVSKIQDKLKDTKSEADEEPPETTGHEATNPASILTGEHSILMENEVTDALLKKNSRVVCIWGDSGMGKSTLARKIYKHNADGEHFKHFAWVSMNQDFQTKKVLKAILKQLCPDARDIKDKDEIQLSQEIFTTLEEKICLVVLEDMEDEQVWQIIRVAFPIGSSGDSRILITTPWKAVADEASESAGGVAYEMRPLSQAEWLKIFWEKGSIDDQESRLGKTIFNLSAGSPLIAGILGKYLKTLDIATRNQLVGEIDSYRNGTSDGKPGVLELCYDRLPHGLKPCLVYMGQFPKGKNIEADKLYLLLAAEGLILPDDTKSGKTLPMKSLMKMIEELALKGLVEAQEDEAPTTTMYKSCRIHDQIRRLCISRGGREDFFEIVDFGDGAEEPSTHRLAVYMNKYGDGNGFQLMSQDIVKKIRSLLIFDTYDPEKESWPKAINDLKKFSHLRVLDFDGVDFRHRKLPKGIDKLVFLRYLSFRECYLESLPSSISKLPWLETLDLRVAADCSMTIPNILSNLKRLRHLYFPLDYQSDDRGKLQLHGLELLEILVNFDTGVCNTKDLLQLKNLEILTTISEGNHKDLDDIVKYLSQQNETDLQESSLIIRNFDCFSADRATDFKNLLQCKSLHSLDIEGQIGNLPEDIQISPSFIEMVFNGSELEDDPMSILGKLQNLKSLVLCNDAFIGDKMTFSAASKFPSLRILKLENLQYLEKLTFEQEAMPELSTLIIENCECLKEVFMPEALDDRLRLAHGKKRGNAYFVEPRFKIILHT